MREPLPQGGEVRTVIVDEERAKIIRWGYETYATGLYSIADITTLLEVRGLRSRPTPCYTSKPLSQSAIHALLSNRYYIGAVKYHGKHYPGRHDKIISEELFEQVQAVLAAHKLAGERDRKHQHYLKGSIFCGICGRQLTYSRNTGSGGTYEYFVCLGNQRRECAQRAQRVDAIEAAVEQHYRTIAFSPADCKRVRATAEKRLVQMTEVSTQEIERCNGLLDDLKTQERKLMEKDYRNEISAELFSEESARIKRERLDATAILKRLSVRHEEIQDALALVLAILDHDLYLRATATQRRFINQAIFEAIWISHEDIERSQLSAPFAELRILSEATRIVEGAAARQAAGGRANGLQRAKNGQSSRPLEESRALALSSITTSMVEAAGVLSNHDLQGRLRRVVKKLAALRASGDVREESRSCRERPRRPGWVVKAIVNVLADRGEPMRAKEIHAAVETLLGGPVSWSSVKQALATHVDGPSPRFVRIARGRYMLA